MASNCVDVGTKKKIAWPEEVSSRFIDIYNEVMKPGVAERISECFIDVYNESDEIGGMFALVSDDSVKPLRALSVTLHSIGAVLSTKSFSCNVGAAGVKIN